MVPFFQHCILVDCGRPRSNAVDWATQVSQQNKATEALGARGCGGAGKKGR